MRRRRGFTLTEILVAAGIGALALGMALTLYWAARRMTRAGDLAGSLAEASIAMELIHRDLVQAVQKPDPAIDRVVYVTKESVRFVRGDRDAQGALVGQLVVYRKEAAGKDRFRLMRKHGAEPERALPGQYIAVRFTSFNGTGGPFVRVTLRVANTEAGENVDRSTLSSLVRVAGPEMLDTPFFKWTVMEKLQSVEGPAVK